MVRGFAAATLAMRSFWRPGRSIWGLSWPSPSHSPFRPAKTNAISERAAKAVARSQGFLAHHGRNTDPEHGQVQLLLEVGGARFHDDLVNGSGRKRADGHDLGAGRSEIFLAPAEIPTVDHARAIDRQAARPGGHETDRMVTAVVGRVEEARACREVPYGKACRLLAHEHEGGIGCCDRPLHRTFERGSVEDFDRDVAPDQGDEAMIGAAEFVVERDALGQSLG